MVPNTQTFTNVDPEKWVRIQEQVHSQLGVVIGSDVGSASTKGVSISWVYDPNTEILSVTLVAEAWYDPSQDKIEAKIAAAINAA